MSASHNFVFDNTTKGSDVATLFRDHVEGRHIVITGVSPNSLGEATALALAASNPGLLILASRTLSKVENVAAAIRSRFQNVKLQIAVLDLASQNSVRAAAAQIIRQTDHLDLLINNAGISLGTRRSAPSGLELTFATNHVGPFLFTELLLPLLRNSAWAQAKPGLTRIVNLSSAAHYICPFRFSDHNFTGNRPLPADEEPRKGYAEHFYAVNDGFSGWMAYASSKTANILFTVSLQKRLGREGIQCLAVDPGTILTNIVDDVSASAAAAIRKMPKESFKTVDQGCATTIVAALQPDLADTVYLADCKKARPARHAVDQVRAERLWKLTEELLHKSCQPKI